MKLYETITAENWCKHALDDGQGRACLIEHQARNYHHPSLAYYDVMRRLEAAIEVLFPERVHHRGGRVDFNNHPDTTLDDVLRVCKLADV